MAAITRFVKTDITQRSTTSATAIELTSYTVAWSDLTGAGFAAGDDVIIQVDCKVGGSNANQNFGFGVGFGTTYAGRTDDTSADWRVEPVANGAAQQYSWFTRRTLVTSENIYFSGSATGGLTAFYDELVVRVLKLDDLSSNDFVYAENAPGSATPTAYNTSGASITIPATGDWLISTSVRFDVVVALLDIAVAIHNGTTDISEILIETADVIDFHVVGTIAYQAGLAASTTVRVRHKAETSAAATTTHTRIFALRLDAFEDHAGAQTANTVTHSVLDTYSEVAGFPSYGLTTTGPFMVIGWPIHDNGAASPDANYRPYGRIQIGGSDWPAANANRKAVSDNKGSLGARVAPLLFGYNASQTAATLDIDLDCAEDADVAPNRRCLVQVAAAFSLTLAGGDETLVLDTDGVAVAGADLLANVLATLDTGTATVAGTDLTPILSTIITLDTGAVTGAGADLVANAQAVLDTGASTVAGADLTILEAKTLTLDTGAVTVAGADLVQLTNVVLDTGTAALAGNDLTILGDKTEVLDTGAAGVAGADLLAAVAVVVDTGAVTAAGNDLTVLQATTVTLDVGAGTVAGADLLAHAQVAFDQGAATAAGEDLGTTPATSIDQGAVAVAGADLEILTAGAVVLDAGAVMVAGEDLVIFAPSSLVFDEGTAAVAGADLTILQAATLVLDVGAAMVAGADLGAAARITLDVGAASAAGNDLATNVAVLLDAGAAAVAGQDITPLAAGVTLLDNGAVGVAGADLVVLADSTLALDAGAVAGSGADLAVITTVAVDQGAAAVAGQDLALQAAGAVALDNGAVGVSGNDLVPQLTNFTVEAGAVAVAGADVTVGYQVTLEEGSVAGAGNDLIASLAAILDQGVVALGGTDLAVVQGEMGSFVRGQHFVVAFDPGGQAFEGLVFNEGQSFEATSGRTAA